jgi:NitT/TauT family transport system substrate-binding protein
MIRLCEPFRGVLYTPFYLVQALGGYEAEGVEVSLDTAASPAGAATALLSGGVDVIWGGPMRVLHHFDRDPDCPLVLFGEAVTRDPFFLVGRRPSPAFSFTDLAGLRLATVSEVPTPWLCLQEDLRRAGIDPEALKRVADRAMEANAAALRAAEVDVTQVFEPFVETLAREGTGHVWRAAAGRGRTAYTSYYTTRRTLEARREDLLGMTRALYRTQRWLRGAAAAEVAGAVAEFFPDLAGEVLTGAIARYQSLGVWNENPVLSREGFDRLKTGLLSGGWIVRDTPFAACVDNHLAEQAVAEHPPPLAP